MADDTDSQFPDGYQPLPTDEILYDKDGNVISKKDGEVSQESEGPLTLTQWIIVGASVVILFVGGFVIYRCFTSCRAKRRMVKQLAKKKPMAPPPKVPKSPKHV